MSRFVHSILLAHLQGPATTTCRLLKIRSSSGVVFGIGTLDRAIDYDDGSGDGVVTYVGVNGFDPSALSADLGFSVDNAEGMALLSDEVEGVTQEMIDAGEFDDGTWVCYLINFNDTTSGRHAELGSGDLGEIRTRYGMMWIPELLDIMVRLRQPIGVVTSRKCRATFGVPATQDNGQNGCGIDITALWVNGTVTAVGTESNRHFTGSAVATPSFPGRVQFLTGANAGRTFATESVSGLVVELIETTMYPITVGDTYKIRPDCGKRYIEDCITLWANGPNFKGEPYIPDGGDVASVQ